jgi:hypothetical protein
MSLIATTPAPASTFAYVARAMKYRVDSRDFIDADGHLKRHPSQIRSHDLAAMISPALTADYEDWISIPKNVRPLFTADGTYRPFTSNVISLIVGRISRYTTAAQLRAVFATFGPVRDVYIPKHFITNEPKNYAFIELDATSNWSAALESRATLNGRRLQVQVAMNGRRDPEYMASVAGDEFMAVADATTIAS